ncbi:uncharacterized protein LOC121389235 [Gigantopelta aegis]|uniref:uncharacterized protein LOC121389235 n=1 Tax=Gigantopelta aegis TaxID=1735272 RepID=UPI001B88B7F1|nr:uncharacterized protein LOC121389235 [Gigantopelta aegis]
MVYNNGTTTPPTTESFTCLVIQKMGEVVKISQNPLECLWNQTANSSTSLGKLSFAFAPVGGPNNKDLCPIVDSTPTDLEPTTIALISVGVFLLLLLIIGVGLCWYRSKRQNRNKDNYTLWNIFTNILH